ncbi:MAG: EAL domain-containing protein [Parvibaculaceae bacterium]
MSRISIAAILAGTGPVPSAPAAEPASGGPAPSASSVDALARVRDLDELERIRRAVHATGEVAYHWHLASDALVWAGEVGRALDVENGPAIATGRAYARLLDRDNVTSRFDAVTSSGVRDEGEGVPYAIEYQIRPFGPDDERSHWVEDTGRWYAGSDGRPAEAFGIVRRIDDRHSRDEHLRLLGTSDPLTGMMNRSRLADALNEALEASKRDGVGFAFLVAAVSNLNVVNHAYGFEVADEVVNALAQRLRQVVRGGDSIGRYSGGKFGMILANCSEVDFEFAVRRFLGVARDSVIETSKGPVWATLSIGGIVLPRHAGDAHTAMARAEEALAAAKRQPTDGFVLYKPSPELASLRNLNARCGAEILSSLREDRLTLAFQPIVDARTGAVAMHEALLRLITPEGQPVEAAHLISIAEKLGLVRLVDRTVMGLAVAELQRNPAARISLNISGVTATDPRWSGLITDILRENREIAGRLMIEITETAALNDLDHVTSFIDQLRELGCRVAIDDFGAGYTSFRNLKVLDVDMVKIDGTFCENVAQSPENQYFVRILIDLARRFDLRTVAEWVSSEEDAEILRALGVDYLQGNLFGAATIPLTVEPEEEILEEAASAADAEEIGELPAEVSMPIPEEAVREPAIEETALEESSFDPVDDMPAFAPVKASLEPQEPVEADAPDDTDDDPDGSFLRKAMASLDAFRKPAA